MGGSGKWVKSLIGLKKPDREDCKVRDGCSCILDIGKNRFGFHKLFVSLSLSFSCVNFDL